MSTYPGDWDMRPAAMNIYIEAFEYIEFENVQNFLEPDRDNPWRGLH
jgi:hypothetical protein